MIVDFPQRGRYRVVTQEGSINGMKAAHTTIQFDLPAADLDIIRKAADAAGMTVGQYFRSVMSTKLGTSRPNPDDLVVTIAAATAA